MSLPAGSYQPASISYLDAGNEIGRMDLYGSELNAGNFVAKIALWATYLDACDALALGARKKDVYNDESLYNVAQPTNGAAREIKLLVQAKDSVDGQAITVTLPTIDPTIPVYVVNINAKDVIQMDSPSQITDFITAFEAFAVNPRTGHALTVAGLRVVGRNS